MARNRFSSNRRSPTLLRRERGMQPRASIDGEECSRIAGEKDPAGHRRNSPFTARMSNSIQSGPAKVSVQRKNGIFEVKGVMSIAVDPDVTYGILTDYENNPRVFKTVTKVEVEDKENVKLVTQHANWNIMLWSGKFTIKY
ncbi:uncharacterized protein [Physcomitrium patens]|uniref:Uncharacterized protein n=1 Tax=Physcomitrium patens TaxID=3218 RepID=A0A7I4F036_PHYPA|nr:uncharacterized protein LOC112288440 [Physcomitrium patens]XP_024388370.1 uncharacterized protein LOC112288440 [Physcomitrium patens]|eukprot:XP_024388369.1 uncharacterized protein LOC112288440 [Physcomitrella patens]